MPYRLPPDERLPRIPDNSTRLAPVYWSCYHALMAMEERSRTPAQAAWVYEFQQKIMKSRESAELAPTNAEPQIPMIQSKPTAPSAPVRPTPPVKPVPPATAVPAAEESQPLAGRSASTGRGRRARVTRESTREIIEDDEDINASTHETVIPALPPSPAMPPPASPMPPASRSGPYGPPPPRPPPPPSRYESGDEEEDPEGYEGDESEEEGEPGHSAGYEPARHSYPQLGERPEIMPPEGIPLQQRHKNLDPLVGSLMDQITTMQRQGTFLTAEVKLMARQSAEESRRAADMTVRTAREYAQMSKEQAMSSMQIVNQLAETLQANNVNNINLTNQMTQTAIRIMEQMTASSTKIIESLDKRVIEGEKAQNEAMKTYADSIRKSARADIVLEQNGAMPQQEYVPETEEGEPKSEVDKMMGSVLQNGLQTGIANAVGQGIDKALEALLPKIMSMVMPKKTGPDPAP